MKKKERSKDEKMKSRNHARKGQRFLSWLLPLLYFLGFFCTSLVLSFFLSSYLFKNPQLWQCASSSCPLDHTRSLPSEHDLCNKHKIISQGARKCVAWWWLSVLCLPPSWERFLQVKIPEKRIGKTTTPCMYLHVHI